MKKNNPMINSQKFNFLGWIWSEGHKNSKKRPFFFQKTIYAYFLGEIVSQHVVFGHRNVLQSWTLIDSLSFFGLLTRIYLIWRSDISSKARNLLSRLSKVLVRSQALKKSQKDLICKQRWIPLLQRCYYPIILLFLLPFLCWILLIVNLFSIFRISEILRDESWKSEVDITVSIWGRIQYQVSIVKLAIYIRVLKCLAK